jgi:hypothetical protein
MQTAETPRRAHAFFVLMLLLAVTACATTREIQKPVSENRMFVTRSGENVSLSWDSRPGLSYTVYYNQTRSARQPWKVLPGFDHIRGTGRTLSYTDRVPAGEERFYRLHSEPSISLGP